MLLLTNGKISGSGLSVKTCFEEEEGEEGMDTGWFKLSIIFLTFMGPTFVVDKYSWRVPRVETIDLFGLSLSSFVGVSFVTGIKLPPKSKE